MNSTLTQRSPAAVNIDDVFAGGDFYAVLNALLPVIDSSAERNHDRATSREPSLVHAALLAVKSYVALGLIRPAHELLSQAWSPLAGVVEFEPLRLQLAALPTGMLPRQTLQDRFERNASTLYQRHPHLRQHDAAFRSVSSTFEVFWSTDGNTHASRVREDGRREWLPVPVNAGAILSAVQLPHDPTGLFAPPFVITGDHFGGLFRKVFDGTQKMFMTFSPRIYIVESDISAFGLALHQEQDISRWCHERVSIFVGPAAVPDFKTHLRSNPRLTPPAYCLRMPFARTNETAPLLESIRRAVLSLNDRTATSLGNVRTYYESMDVPAWAVRYAEGRPLRILGITSRFTTVLQYAMRDTKAAFERLGHEFHILMEPTDHDLPTAAASTECLDQFRPDMIFVIDHHRRDYRQTVPDNVPFVCWVQDALPHLMNTEAGRSIGPLDYFISADPDELARCYAYPRERGFGRTLPTNHHLYDAAPAPEAERAKYRCDFSFVSNQSTPPEAFHGSYLEKNRCAPEVARVLEFLFERLRRKIVESTESAGSIVAGDLIAELQRETGLVPASVEFRDHVNRTYIHPLSELFFRQTALEWVADYCNRTGRTLSLYGTGWSEHPRLARHARGVIENGAALRALYQASTINLQIIGSGSIHQRLLDGLAAGGFFFVREAAIDRAHEACEKVLRLVDSGAIEVGRSMDRSTMPDIAEAMHGVRLIIGTRAGGPVVSLTQADIDMIRGVYDMRHRRFASAVFGSHYDRVAFATRGQFEQLADAFLQDSESRGQVAAAMRELVLNRFTYDAFARDLLGFVRERLAAQS